MIHLFVLAAAVATDAPTEAPTLQPTDTFEPSRVYLEDWALVANTGVGCDDRTTFSGFSNPVRVLVDNPTGTASIGSNVKVWQAQYGFITMLVNTVGRYSPVYVWFNVSTTVSPSLRFVDVWVCTNATAQPYTPQDSQLYRRCGPKVTHLAYPLDCADSTTPFQECKCTNESEYTALNASSCDTMCAAVSKNCTSARFKYNTTLPPTTAPVTATPTANPTSPPTPAPAFGCSRVVANLDGLCGASAVPKDLRDDTVCTFSVTPGVGTFDIRMTSEVATCSCDTWGANLSTLSGGAYTFNCTAATYDPDATTTTTAPQLVPPIKPGCLLLADENPWTRCESPVDAYQTCVYTRECDVGLACRNYGGGLECLTYDACAARSAGTTDCAPVNTSTVSNNISSNWCKAGDFWEATDYTVVNTVTAPWDGTNVGASANTAIVSALNDIFVNASGYDDSTCVCTDLRKIGWTPHLVMVANTQAPTASGVSTLPPTNPYTTSAAPTPAPTSAAPTAAPTSSAPTSAAPTLTTTLPPTPAAFPFPSVPEMCTESEPFAAWAICLFQPSNNQSAYNTYYGSIACNSSVYAATCATTSACPNHYEAGLGGSMCASAPFTPYLPTLPQYYVTAPNAVNPMYYELCTQEYHGTAAACVDGSGYIGAPVMWYCYVPNMIGPCRESYPCTGPHETFFGPSSLDKTSTACYLPTAAPVAPTTPPTANPTSTAPPTTVPTAAPSYAPTGAPTPFYPLVNNPDNTVREFWPAFDNKVGYVWQYRLRGPYVVVDSAGDVTLMDPDKDVLWPTDERCDADPSCTAVKTLNLVGDTYQCQWLCIQNFGVNQSEAPLILQTGTTLNLSLCNVPRSIFMNSLIVSPFMLSTQFPDILDTVSKIDPSASLVNMFLWAPWFNMTHDWIRSNNYDPDMCSGDVGLIDSSSRCRGLLVFYESYTDWLLSRDNLTQQYLNNTDFPELKARTYGLYPDMNVTFWPKYGGPASTPVLVTWDNETNANTKRVFSILGSYQAVTLRGIAGCTELSIHGYAMGAYAHETTDPNSALTGVWLSTVRMEPNATGYPSCDTGEVCGSVNGGHSACRNITDKTACNMTALCYVCELGATSTSAPTSVDTLPPTPVRASRAGSVDTTPIVAIISGVAGAVVIIVMIVAVMQCYRIHSGKAELDPDEEPLVPL